VVHLENSFAPLQAIAERLETAGCRVSRRGSDWLDYSRFSSGL
jgi:hypothetical protein